MSFDILQSMSMNSMTKLSFQLHYLPYFSYLPNLAQRSAHSVLYFQHYSLTECIVYFILSVSFRKCYVLYLRACFSSASLFITNIYYCSCFYTLNLSTYDFNLILAMSNFSFCALRVPISSLKCMIVLNDAYSICLNFCKLAVIFFYSNAQNSHISAQLDGRITVFWVRILGIGSQCSLVGGYQFEEKELNEEVLHERMSILYRILVIVNVIYIIQQTFMKDSNIPIEINSSILVLK